MNYFMYNMLLALAWVAITGYFTLGNALVGFVVGHFALRIARDPQRTRGYSKKLLRTFGLIIFFLRELTWASLRVAWEVITPRAGMSPAIVAVPLDARSDFEILLLTTMVTMTPDSLTVDVSPDRRYMYIHCMFVTDVEEYRRHFKNTLERKVMEVTR